MIDTLHSILLILAVLAVIAIPLLIYVWIRTIPETGRIKRFAEFVAARTKVSDLEFCQRAQLSDQDLPLIRKLREGLGREVNVEPELIYPEDELYSFGFEYDDSVSGFIKGCGLIDKDPYWFPLEQGSTIQDIFPWIHQITSEQGTPGHRQ